MTASGAADKRIFERVGVIAAIVTLIFAALGFTGYLPAAKSHYWWPYHRPIPLSARTASQIKLPDHYTLSSWLSNIGVTGHDIGHVTMSKPAFSLINQQAYVALSVQNLQTSESATFSIDCSRNSGTRPAPGPYLIHLHEPPAQARAITQDGGNWWDGNGDLSTATFTMEGAVCSENGKAVGTRWASLTTTPAFAWEYRQSTADNFAFPIPENAAAKLLAFVFIADNGDYAVSAI